MNEEKPIAVLVSPVLPFPTGSGRALRSWDWLRSLSRDYRVHVLTLEGAGGSSTIPKDYPAERVWLIANAKVSGSTFRRSIGLLLPFLAPRFHSLVIDWIDVPASDTTLRDMETCLAQESVRSIVVFRLYMHKLGLAVRSRFPEAVMTLDLDDHESLTRFSVAGAFARMRRYREAVREGASAIQYCFLERYMSGPYHVAYLASEADSGRLTTSLARSVAHRPNRLDVPQDFPRVPSAKALTLLFVGELSYAPNEEAVRFMVTQLVPELGKRLAGPWRLYVVGQHASAELSQLMQRSEHVEFIGNADTLEEWYEAAHIVLVPMRSGGGTKFKTLEAFAHRRPVISTRHGMRGLGALEEKHFLLAETASMFALAISRLASDQALADRIAEAGWLHCCEHHRVE